MTCVDCFAVPETVFIFIVKLFCFRIGDFYAFKRFVHRVADEHFFLDALHLRFEFGVELIKIFSCVEQKKFLADKFVEDRFSSSLVAEISSLASERKEHRVKFRLRDLFRSDRGNDF